MNNQYGLVNHILTTTMVTSVSAFLPLAFPEKLLSVFVLAIAAETGRQLISYIASKYKK